MKHTQQLANTLAIQANNLTKRYLTTQRMDRLTALLHTLLFAKAKQTEDENSFINALSDISFELSQGQRLGIVGRNGSGKSTLLKILSRVTPPTSGEALIRGKLSALLEVGTGLNRELTGIENIYLIGAVLGMHRSEIAIKLEEILAFAGLGKAIHNPAKTYSSGMQLRLSFSVSAFLDTQIMLIDEALSVGDYDFRMKCKSKIRELINNANRSVILVSHELDSIRELTQRVMWLEQGRIVMIGETEAVCSAYEKSFIVPNSEPFE